ncbi:hypothetical protein [Hydrogenophaga aquatica]
MSTKKISANARHVLVVGLFLVPLISTAQGTEPPADVDWKKANETVGTFKRGHADILKWEQSNLPAEKATDLRPPAFALMTVEQVVRQAWKAHPSLAKALSGLGEPAVREIAAGRFQVVDAVLRRRVGDLPEILEVATDAKKAWIDAVAARQLVRYQREALEAAEAANELGRRMVSVGNWSRLQQTQVQLAESAARGNLVRAEFAAEQAQSRLIKTLQLTGVQDEVGLPDALPGLPVQPVSQEEVTRQLETYLSWASRVEQMQIKSKLRLASGAYRGAYQLAKISQSEVLAVRKFVSEETVLHYNGMLKSVWNLLDEVRNQSQAMVDAVGAQKDFWTAEADLQWVLVGGGPSAFVSLGGGSGEQAAAAGH